MSQHLVWASCCFLPGRGHQIVETRRVPQRAASVTTRSSVHPGMERSVPGAAALRPWLSSALRMTFLTHKPPRSCIQTQLGSAVLACQ